MGGTESSATGTPAAGFESCLRAETDPHPPCDWSSRAAEGMTLLGLLYQPPHLRLWDEHLSVFLACGGGLSISGDDGAATRAAVVERNRIAERILRQTDLCMSPVQLARTFRNVSRCFRATGCGRVTRTVEIDVEEGPAAVLRTLMGVVQHAETCPDCRPYRERCVVCLLVLWTWTDEQRQTRDHPALLLVDGVGRDLQYWVRRDA